MDILGIDIGGTGIKGAPVNVRSGEMLADRYRIPTPVPSKPEPVARTVEKICKEFRWKGPVGIGFPAVVQNGVVRTAANIHDDWINTDADTLLSQATGLEVFVLNDGDAAGLAEMRFGAGKGAQGVVAIVTIGTGLGTAIFSDGVLVPNTELGHLIIKGKDAEKLASDAARKRDGLSWKKWAKRFSAYLAYLEDLIWPDLIILGGGASKKTDKFMHHLNIRTQVLPAQLLNEAGIIGAAMAGERAMKGRA